MIGSIRNCLAFCSYILSSCSYSSFLDFYRAVGNNSTVAMETLGISFVFFVRLTCSLDLQSKVDKLSLEEMLISPLLKKSRSRFFFLVKLLVYFTSQKNIHSLLPFWFVLHYRGLSNTGFHFLHQIGFGPSVSSLPSLWSRSLEIFSPASPVGQILWSDNLRRNLAGRLPTDFRVDWTVIGYTEIPQSLPFNEYFPSVDIFIDISVSFMISNLFLNMDSIIPMVNLPSTLSVPLRHKSFVKFQFFEKDILPIACGTILGTLTVLRHIMTYNPSNIFTFLVVDYDIYWRIYKLMFSSSMIGCLSTVKKRLILIQGPWHIYKSICEAVWEFFSPLILARIWLHIFKSQCPQKPPLKDILVIFISLFVLSHQMDFEIFLLKKTVYGKCIHILLNHLIPLVRLFYFFFLYLLSSSF